MNAKDLLRPSFTLLFWSKPVPECPKDYFDMLCKTEEENKKDDQMEHLSTQLIEALTPWTVDKYGVIKTQFEFSNFWTYEPYESLG